MILAGIHAAKHALESGDPIVEMIIDRGKKHPRINELIYLTRKQGVRVSFQPRQALDRLSGGVPHQGVVARVQSKKKIRFEDWLEGLDMRGGTLVLLLDGVTDPHNLGACVRTAEAAGCSGVVIPRDHAVDTGSPAVAKAACGALSRLPVLTVTNLVRAMKQLQGKGVWLAGLAGDSETSMYRAALNGNLGLVMGAEGKGLRHLVRERCDVLLSIPMPGCVESLNVSVAAGVALFEVIRQRQHQCGQGV